MDKQTISEIAGIKNVALIAHDNKKQDLIKWCLRNQAILEHHNLCGTGTTARMINEATGLNVFEHKSGPLGGDQQIGAKIVDGEVNVLIFFADPLTAQPHDPDVKALLRIAQVYDIPVATNLSTADFLITSSLFERNYERHLTEFQSRR